MNDFSNVLDDFLCDLTCEDVYPYWNDIDLDEWSNW